MIRWFIQKQDIGPTHEMPRESKPSALTTTQLFERLSTCFFRIETEPLQHGVHSRSESVATLAIEPFEVAIIVGEHLRRGRFTHL